MQVTLSTIWTIPAGFALEHAQDEGIILFLGAQTEYDIEENPEDWDALVAKATSENDHIRIVDITIDYDQVVKVFATTTVEGTVEAQ